MCGPNFQNNKIIERKTYSATLPYITYNYKMTNSKKNYFKTVLVTDFMVNFRKQSFFSIIQDFSTFFDIFANA